MEGEGRTARPFGVGWSKGPRFGASPHPETPQDEPEGRPSQATGHGGSTLPLNGRVRRSVPLGRDKSFLNHNHGRAPLVHPGL